MPLEDFIDLSLIGTPIRECVSVRLGIVPASVIDALKAGSYDQAPVIEGDPSYNFFDLRPIGVVPTGDLCDLAAEGRPLTADNPTIRCRMGDIHELREAQSKDRDVVFDRGCFTDNDAFIVDLLYMLSLHSCCLATQTSELMSGDPLSHGRFIEEYFLITVADVNKAPLRSLLYGAFHDFELGLSRLSQRHVPDARSWLSLLSGHSRNQVMRTWELSQRQEADFDPLHYCRLGDLLSIVVDNRDLRAVLGITNEEAFRVASRRLREARNRVMHPVKPIALDVEDLDKWLGTIDELDAMSRAVAKAMQSPA